MKAGFSIKIGFHFFQKLKKRNIKWYTMVWGDCYGKKKRKNYLAPMVKAIIIFSWCYFINRPGSNLLFFY